MRQTPEIGLAFSSEQSVHVCVMRLRNTQTTKQRKGGSMDLREIQFGIEIETVKRTRDRVAKAIQSVVGGEVRHVGTPSTFDPWEVTDEEGRIWKVVADGSLTDVPPHLRAEVVSPVLRYTDIPILQEVIRAIRRCGARPNRQSGLHLHADASAFDGRTLGNLAKIVYKQERLIHAALGINDSRLHTYTKPMRDELIAKIERYRPKTKEEMNKLWYGYHNRNPQHYDNSRRHGVNLHSVWYRGTVEFRWPNSTLHAGKVKAYVQFCLALIAKSLNGRAASSKRRDFDPESARYDFRTFLLRLNLVGDEFKTARKHLLAALPGDSAFKRGRPKRDEKKSGVESDADGNGGGNSDAVPVLVSESQDQPSSLDHETSTLGGES